MGFWEWLVLATIALLAWAYWSTRQSLIREASERERRRREYDELVPAGREGDAAHLADIVRDAKTSKAWHRAYRFEHYGREYSQHMARARRYVRDRPELGPLLTWLLREHGVGPESSREEMAPALSGGDCSMGPAVA